MFTAPNLYPLKSVYAVGTFLSARKACNELWERHVAQPGHLGTAHVRLRSKFCILISATLFDTVRPQKLKEHRQIT
jgi:hypothetical protein